MKSIFGLLFILCASFAFPDAMAYSDIKHFMIESRNYYIVHYHNWSKVTGSIFHNINNHSYIEVINKATNRKIFRVPAPALTHLYISEDEQYIVGISNIMIYNPYQLIIVNINGKILKKRHIAIMEARMNEQDFNNFRKNFPSAFHYLQSNKRIYSIDSYYYIDFFDLNLSVIFNKRTFDFLFNYITANHLSENISTSVTNHIYWFNKNNPNMRFNYRNNELYSINVLDQENIMMEILVNENG
jgi:hypothetical protein